MAKRAKPTEAEEKQRKLGCLVVSVMLIVAFIGLTIYEAFSPAPTAPAQTGAVVAPPPPAPDFKESDFVFNANTVKYKSIIVIAVNRIAKEDSRCAGSTDPTSVDIAIGQSTRKKPIFYVACGKGDDVVNVFFTPADVAANKVFSAPTYIDEQQAVDICEQYVKQQLNFPSTMDFSRILALAAHNAPNGNTSIDTSFSAKNGFGVEQDYTVHCLLNSKGWIEGQIQQQ
jgi:hypothetical protein